jgi:hypothetical protein
MRLKIYIKNWKDHNMTAKFVLALGLGLALSSPVSAETFLNPDRAWWSTFFQAVDGVQPDFERIAQKAPEYLAADEFDRAEVLAKLVAELQAAQAQIDVPGAEVTISIRAKLGDYSVENAGFPVSIFSQNVHLTLESNGLYFRNWQDFNIFPANKDEGKALRSRIGTQALAADVTLTDFKKSTTRPNAYDGFVTNVAYFAEDGLPIAEFTAEQIAPIPASDAADKVAAVQQLVVDAAGIPALGTSWRDAQALIQQSFPYAASDDFAYTEAGKMLAYRFDGGAVVKEDAHAADQQFRVYLQQVEGDWRKKRGFSVDLSAGDGVDITGTGPGLACYTPDIIDRCAVLEFSPSDGGHILTRAYGVVETERLGNPQQAFEALIGSNGDAFKRFTTKLDYDPASLKSGVTPKFPSRGGVSAYAAGAGAIREGAPFYDPLKNTSGMNAINREIALFAVDGADARIPMIFVLQQ